MGLDGKDALASFHALKEREAQKAADRLAAARADAAARGKEPFDYQKLAQLASTVYEATMHMSEAERQAYFEELYYLGYPEVRSITELADKVNELSRWM